MHWCVTARLCNRLSTYIIIYRQLLTHWAKLLTHGLAVLCVLHCFIHIEFNLSAGLLWSQWVCLSDAWERSRPSAIVYQISESTINLPREESYRLYRTNIRNFFYITTSIVLKVTTTYFIISKQLTWWDLMDNQSFLSKLIFGS